MKMSTLLTFIKNRELEIIIAIGGIAALLSFVLENEDIFNYGIIFSSIGLISIGMRSYLRKKNKT
jgi:energy-converting hydrogenase Eha subunit H|tara:strand:- start:887 stop:1081 length:195 start_codon:yes stop_codon:yes gene_type:complete